MIINNLKNKNIIAAIVMWLLVLALLVTVPVVIQGAELSAEQIKKVTGKWKCKYCPYDDESKLDASIEIGLGDKSNDSFYYNDYSGIAEDGAFLKAKVDIDYRNDEGNYFSLKGQQLGIDSRHVLIQEGKQGGHRFEFEYDQLPRFGTEELYTPYSGGADLTLQNSWVTAANTGNMTALGTAVANSEIRTKRNTYALRGDFRLSDRVSIHFRSKRQTKVGNKSIGAPLGATFSATRSVLLLEPIDYTTDDISLAFRYTGKKFLGEVTGSLSIFKNQNKSLKWQNAFTEPSTFVTDEGQMALPPDNILQQLSFAGLYKLNKGSSLSGTFVVSQTTQDDTFLPYTINNNIPGVGGLGLPNSSLGGKIDIFNAKLMLSTRVTEKLHVDLKYSEEQYDNETSNELYRYVTADADFDVTTFQRYNFPISYKKHSVLAKANYSFAKSSRVIFGYDNRNIERPRQEVEETKEDIVWLKLNHTLNEKVDIGLKRQQQSRTGSEYRRLDQSFPIETLLLRKYNIADRDRNNTGLYLSATPTKLLALNILAEFSNDNYDKSVYGLTESEEVSYSIGLDYKVLKKLSIHGFYNLANVSAKRAGNGPNPIVLEDWFAEDEDQIVTSGFDLNYQIEDKDVELGFSFTISDSTGQTRIDVSSTSSVFPDFTSQRQSLYIYAKKSIKENLELTLGYYQQSLEQSDWALNNVALDGVPDVLSLGEIEPSYTIDLVTLTAKYIF